MPFSKVPLLAGLVGVLVGIVGVVLFALTHLGYRYFFGSVGNIEQPEPGGSAVLEKSHSWLAELESMLPTSGSEGPELWVYVIVPILGGILIALWTKLARDNGEGGTEGAIDSYHQKRGKFAPGMWWKKLVASCITLGTGGSGGREGPISAIGAAIGSNVAERFRLTVRERRILLAAGIAAGVGGMFRAPLAGGLLAAEILYSDSEFEPEVLIPAMLSSVASYCVFCLNFGWGSLLSGVAGDYTFANPVELAAYAALAVVLVLGGLMYVRILRAIKALFRKVPATIRPAVGAGLAGVVTLVILLMVNENAGILHSLMGDGYGGLQSALDGTGVWYVFLILAVGKMLTSALTIQSGGAAGLFAPSMVIGGAIGAMSGTLFAMLVPDSWNIHVPVGVYALVGMAGYYAATAKAPVSTVIMVSELTGSYHLLLPSMWVCTLAFILSRKYRMYETQVSTRKESPAHRGDFATNVLDEVKVVDILPELTEVETVREDTPLSEILSMKTSRQAYYPVLSRAGKFVGIFSLNDLRSVLDEQEVWEFLVAADIAHGEVVTVRPSETLSRVAQKFAETQFEELPVVDDTDEKRLLGMISRRQLNSAYIRRMMSYDQARKLDSAQADAAT